MQDEYMYGLRARGNVGYGLWQMAVASRQTLNTASFNTAFDTMTGFMSDKGRPLNMRPTHLVVPTSLRSAAAEVVKAQFLTTGSTNANYNVVEVLETAWVN
jgi:phage major head subunit gpT-like protein